MGADNKFASDETPTPALPDSTALITGRSTGGGSKNSRCHHLIIALLLLAAAGPATKSADPVEVIHNDPTIERIMFDRRHPPDDMPKLNGNEAALTEMQFACGASVDYRIVEKRQVGDHWHVVAHIDSTRVALSLNDRIFLPQSAPLVLRAHEEGHREMNEQVYKTSAAIAKEAAQKMLAKDWEADGADLDAAGKAATDAAVRWMGDEYLAGTAKRASHLGDIYDNITGHGTKPVLVANAIRLSYEQEKKEAATRPTTRP